MHPRFGGTVCYILEVFVVKSEMNAGVFGVAGRHSKAGKVAVAGMFYSLSLAEKADIRRGSSSCYLGTECCPDERA